MSDLISRSELIKHFEAIQQQENVVGLEFIAMIDEIKEQPTAYSVDKVVEELEENASRFTKKYVTPYGNNGYKDTKAISVHKAIEIVKQGGISDDVCEWKYTKEIMDNAEFKVGCNQNALKRGVVPNNFSYHDFKYCPYCGKKIKAVE